MNITEELERHAKRVMPGYPNDVCSRAKSEIERLRAALTELAELGEQGMKPDYSEWLTFHNKVAQVARRALQ